ncbi:amidase [Oceanobacter antarcticus]|uniref:Amidase n=1 Tax=Oceanobacter antarcticus TaxID=3133425 RepID=A0ABW8NFS4_9GAMM
MSILIAALNLTSADRFAAAPTVVVKDTIDIAGHPTRAGSRALELAPVAQQHAEVVDRLLANGWKINGKANLHELAFGTTGVNHWTGTANNPRFPGLIPGGSSSGSAAAVAAGLSAAGVGTDTGGSVRIPAACCGVFGLKPSYGRVSRAGVMPAESTLDCVGPLARDMPTLTAVMEAICCDFVALQPDAPALANLRLGMVVELNASAAVKHTVEAAIAATDLPLHLVTLPGMEQAYQAGMSIINRESWRACQHLLASGLIGDDVAQRLLAAGQTTDQELALAEQVRTEFSAAVDALLTDCPVLALPTMPDCPVSIENAADTRALLGMTAFVRPFNLSGHPAINIPLLSEDGLPVGLQLVAARGADELLCAVAALIASRIASQIATRNNEQ